ncbi:MAG: glycosyltransferase family 1 protein [Propionibacteriaceae bacterium]|jgi:phosphatidylinositol alpha 1,6-mannosyltransferase|nr:glycosyltransferase family 1 protein [Propionibacteriaceae bacterium]
MRVAIVAESFLPQVNGVVNSVLRVCEYLRDHDHEALIIVPDDDDVPVEYAGFEVVTVSTISFPLYTEVKLGVSPSFVMERVIADWGPDVLHAASPFFIGANGILAAARQSIPTVAVYQTDVPNYANRYGLPFLHTMAWRRVRDIHSLANLTLAPSTFTRDQLIEQGVPRVEVWGRGVDTERFDPAKRDQALHDAWAPNGEVVVGFMGRLAPEKQISDLEVLTDIEGIRLVIVGEGPIGRHLEREFPDAVFTGRLMGEELPKALATMDVFVSPGELETFCQSVQEALAAGVPAIAPAQGGPIDLITDGETGFLYPPGDLEAMRGHVLALVEDAERRRSFSQAARRFVADRTWPHLCDQLIGYYHQAMRPLASGELHLDPR